MVEALALQLSERLRTFTPLTTNDGDRRRANVCQPTVASTMSATDSPHRLRAGKQHRACLGHGRNLFGRVRSRHFRPTAFFDECALLPRVDLLELSQVGRTVARKPEIFNADRREYCYDSSVRALLRGRLGLAAGDPSVPSESHDSQGDCPAYSTPKRWFCFDWKFHSAPFH